MESNNKLERVFLTDNNITTLQGMVWYGWIIPTNNLVNCRLQGAANFDEQYIYTKL